MKKDLKRLIINILIPLVLGTIVGLVTSPRNGFDNVVQPIFAPPAILFPIVWSILYALMGVSFYLVGNDEELGKIYYAQLAVNFLWSFIFFTFKLYFIAFIWIILLIILVVKMIRDFYKVSKISAYLQLPYLVWLLFASVLNFSIFLLN